MKKALLFLLMIFSISVYGQNSSANGAFVEMADKLREDGKIWIVVAVVLLVLFGLLIYVISLDKKIGKIERELKNS